MMWVVRAGEEGRLFNDFRRNNVVAIGWNKLGDLSATRPDQLKENIRECYPDEKPGWVNMSTGQVSKFRFEMKPRDHVVTYDPESRMYLVGEIDGDYRRDEKLLEYYHIRQVKWKGGVSRDKLSTSTKNRLGAISTLFQVDPDAEKEVLALLAGGGEPKAPESEKEELQAVREDMLEKAHELIKDVVVSLDWEEAQNLVAGVLRAMGYRTVVVD